MKKTKKGFTIMELLLCIGIIGIVSAMGMTIAKKSTDKAYDMFYYTGFKNLFDICIDAHRTTDDTGVKNDSDRVRLATHLNKYLGQVNKNGTPKAIINIANYTFTANNGIVYEVQNGLGGNVPYIIKMQIPYKKTTTGSNKSVSFYYFMDETRFAIPYLIQNWNWGDADLMYNTSLLPAYLDDGIVGRRNGGTYTPIVYNNYQTVLCTRTGSLVSTSGQTILDCSLVANSNSSTKSIKFSNPGNVKYRKAKTARPVYHHNTEPVEPGTIGEADIKVTN